MTATTRFITLLITTLTIGCTNSEYPRCGVKDTECPGSLICESSYCVAPPVTQVVEHYGKCVDDSECPGDAKCRKGICVETVTVIVAVAPNGCGLKLIKTATPQTKPADPNQGVLAVTVASTVNSATCHPVITQLTTQMTMTGGKFQPMFALESNLFGVPTFKLQGANGIGPTGWYAVTWQMNERLATDTTGFPLTVFCTNCAEDYAKAPTLGIAILTQLTSIRWEEFAGGPTHQDSVDIENFRLF